MLNLIFLLAPIRTEEVAQESNGTMVGVTEMPINDISFIPNVYNDHIGIQNVTVKPEKLVMRSTIDDGSMIRWDLPNHTDEWSFVFDFNELNLEARESASIFMFYTTEKPVIGQFKSGPSKYHGFAVGLEFMGKRIELAHASNDGKDYIGLEDDVLLVDSPDPKRFENLESLKMKVICTKKNLKVEIYNEDKLLYDSFRFFGKEYTEYGKAGGYISLFADYKNVSSGKAFEIRGAQLYQREEGPNYSTTKINTKKILPGVRKLDEITHPNTDVQDLIFKMSAINSFIKVMIGELPETSITKGEKELLKELDSIFEKINKMKGSKKETKKSDFGRKVNDLDIKMMGFSKKMNELEFIIDSLEDKGQKRDISDYVIIGAGVFTVALLLYREFGGMLKNRNNKGVEIK